MIVAVGTCDGHVIYVDISSLHSEGGELRQAGRTRMHHSPVTLLQYVTLPRLNAYHYQEHYRFPPELRFFVSYLASFVTITY